MSKKHNIRWNKDDKKKIANDVRVFNAKLTRTLKAHPEWADYLPARKSTADIKENVVTRQDLKRELNSLERFMKKGNETPITSATGIKTTKWEKKEIGLKVAQINRVRTVEAKKADVSTYKGTMGTIENNGLKHKNYDIDKIKAKDWEKFIATVNRQVLSSYKDDKIEKYKENYLKAIDIVFGYIGKDLKELVSKIPAKELYQLAYDDPVLQLDFIYDPQEAQFIVDNMIEHFNNENYE